MRYFLGIVLIFFLVACAPQPNPVAQKYEMMHLQIAAGGSIDTAVQSAKQQTDIENVLDSKDPKVDMKFSTKYMEPFEGCARYNVLYNFKKTSFPSSEKNINYIVKVCQNEDQNFIAEIAFPEIPEVSGKQYIFDENAKLLQDNQRL